MTAPPEHRAWGHKLSSFGYSTMSARVRSPRRSSLSEPAVLLIKKVVVFPYHNPNLGEAPDEPSCESAEELRLFRKRRLALGYRVFAALGWGNTGDGHITARDPEKTDHFWLLGHGVPFRAATVDEMVLVGPSGEVVEGNTGWGYTPAAYAIHAPIHEARPDMVSAAHTHTAYGTPFAALNQPFRPICQEACLFFERHGVFAGSEVSVDSTQIGKRIAVALSDHRAVILRSHGLLTVGASVDEAVGWFVMAERTAEAHIKARDAQPIPDEAARHARDDMGPDDGWRRFQWLASSLVPDPSVVG